MSEHILGKEAAIALNDFFTNMKKSISGPCETSQDIIARAQERKVACTALVSFLMHTYGPSVATEVSAFVATMVLEITDDDDAAVAASECAFETLGDFMADESEIEEVEAPKSKELLN